MYRPKLYDCTDTSAIHELIRRYPFAALVTGGSELLATHIPLLLRIKENGEPELFGHMARWNPQVELLFAGSEVLCIFNGPNGYISPSWYRDEEDVPTWNYSAVHVYGRCHAIEAHSQVRGLLDETVDHFESGFNEPWNTRAISQTVVENFQKGVAAFSITVMRIQAAKKLGQDKSKADRVRVSTGLDQHNGKGGVCPLAADMRRELKDQH